MFGVADETGELNYGECFIQYSSLTSTNNAQPKLQVITGKFIETFDFCKFYFIEGDIIVTKNPCLWPGDFRRLKAVRNSKLEECMRDVIVFPINGKRPHSNEIAGSDLDGDQYWVYWGEHFKIKENIQPLSYEGAKKKDVPSIDHEIIVNHIVESFSAGVMLGMISNTHTVVADKHEKHSFSAPCKELAELFALAVDSPKTGQFIQKEQIRPYQRDYCKTWPKFMRKFGEPSSDSTSILEQLYNRAEKMYKESVGEIKVNTFTQKKKRALANKIDDKGFEKWLREIDEESPNPTEVKSRKSKPVKSNDDDDDEVETGKKSTAS
jgi:RNA-dependent RNA polymerase